MNARTIGRGLSWLGIGLLLGLGIAAGGARLLPDRWPAWLGGREDPFTVALSSLVAVQRQSKLVVLTARFSSVITSRQQRLGGLLSASKTLIIPGIVRYEVNLAALDRSRLLWDRPSATLTIFAPRPVVAGPEVQLAQAREYRDGTLLMALTNAEEALDAANRAAVGADMLAQARAPVLAGMADEAARDAIQRFFLLPLHASGNTQAKVKVTFVVPPSTAAAPAPAG